MKLLLAEDEKELSRALCAILEHSKYSVDAVYDGEAAVEAAAGNAYDAMIFDIMMPKLDGIDALKTIRSKGDYTPVLLLTAKAEVDDRINGLDAGADDYLTKPFAMGELLARVRSMTRRAAGYKQKKIIVGTVVLNTEEQELSAENSIRLASKEARLMEFLMLNLNKSLTTEELFLHTWGNEENADKKLVWMYVSFLRGKLRAIGADIEIDGEENGSYIIRTAAGGNAL